MYISQIEVNNFRNFQKEKIEFNEGVNVIIGHNNAGKTNLIKALSLVLNFKGGKQLNFDDINKNVSLDKLKESPPKVTISILLKKGKNEDPDDLATIGNWLTKLDADYEALLTYEFFLPEEKTEEYRAVVNSLNLDTSDSNAVKKIWEIIDQDFFRFYVYKLWGGDPSNQSVADSESLQKFDFQFLDAIRDVERDMLSGKNSLLRDVLDFFMDYEIKSRSGENSTDNEKKREILQKRSEFSLKAGELISLLQDRMKEGKKQILSYAKETGASFNKAVPNFEGKVSDVELFSALKLIIEYETGIKIPATHNGLGYNNLIFMSLLLARMQVHSNGEYLGSNAKVFATLAIEEPEAHLHPAMQYKFLKFLRENQNKKKVRQIFVTSHSTHITSAVSLDEIICLHNEGGITSIGYPGRVFPDKESKGFVQRFLDATKSDMLFAQKVILVEGIAEQLILSTLARFEKKSLEDSHVAVILIGGRYFSSFLHLFDKAKPHSIPKKVACITDRDPERKEIGVDSKFMECYPFEYQQDNEKFEYRDHSSQFVTSYLDHPNIRFFSQDPEKGKTFEYDLILHNVTSDLLLTENLSNKTELKSLMNLYLNNKPLDDLINGLTNTRENNRIKEGILSNITWPEDEKKKAIIAARYLNSVSKGENALELTYSLQNNLEREGESEYKSFEVPVYIQQAIEWICQ